MLDDDRRAGALAPDLQLLDRRGAERVARRQPDLESGLAQLGRQLADGRGLAGAVDADHQNDMRLVREIEFQRLGDRRQHLLDLGAP